MLCKIISLPDIKRNMNFNIQVGIIVLNIFFHTIQKLSIYRELHAIKPIANKNSILAYEIQKCTLCYILLNNNITVQT